MPSSDDMRGWEKVVRLEYSNGTECQSYKGLKMTITGGQKKDEL